MLSLRPSSVIAPARTLSDNAPTSPVSPGGQRSARRAPTRAATRCPKAASGPGIDIRSAPISTRAPPAPPAPPATPPPRRPERSGMARDPFPVVGLDAAAFLAELALDPGEQVLA